MQGMDLTSNSYTDKLDISVSGTTPTGGYLNYENSILKDGCLTMDEYKVTIENGEVTTTEKGSCESVSLTACDSPNFKPSPEEWFTFDASTNTITGFSDAWDGTTDIVIPCQIGGVDVLNIGSDSFLNKGLTSVVISDSVINIGQRAFVGNSISELTLGRNIVDIGTAAFISNQLSSLIIPDSVKTIGDAAFHTNKLTNLVIGNNVETLGSSCFYGNQLTELILPDSVTSIDFKYAFGGNNISHLVLGNGITSIPDNAFEKTEGFNLSGKIVIPGSVKTIGDYSFDGHDITEVVFKEGVEVIGEDAFAANEISKVTFSNSVSTIGFAAFYGNKLSEVTIPSGVNFMGTAAFFGNPNLKTVYNNTGKSFDWGMILVGTQDLAEYNFETGTVINEYGNVEVKKSN